MDRPADSKSNQTSYAPSRIGARLLRTARRPQKPCSNPGRRVGGLVTLGVCRAVHANQLLQGLQVDLLSSTIGRGGSVSFFYFSRLFPVVFDAVSAGPARDFGAR